MILLKYRSLEKYQHTKNNIFLWEVYSLKPNKMFLQGILYSICIAPVKTQYINLYNSTCVILLRS